MYFNVRISGKIVGGPEHGMFFELDDFVTFEQSEVAVLTAAAEYVALKNRTVEQTYTNRSFEHVPTLGVRHVEIVQVSMRQVAQVNRVMRAIQMEEELFSWREMTCNMTDEQREEVAESDRYLLRLKELAEHILRFDSIDDLDEQLQK